jgi:fumarate reductase subunit D
VVLDALGYKAPKEATGMITRLYVLVLLLLALWVAVS